MLVKLATMGRRRRSLVAAIQAARSEFDASSPVSREGEGEGRWLSRDELHQFIFDRAKELGITLEREPLS